MGSHIHERVDLKRLNKKIYSEWLEKEKDYDYNLLMKEIRELYIRLIEENQPR